jgi:putative ATP-binding cassette transporter
MSDSQALSSNTSDQQNSKASIPVAFFTLAGGFWRGRSARKAWLLSVLVVATMLANVAVQVANNTWNRTFFDALEKKNLNGLTAALWQLPLLVTGLAVILSGMVISRMTLQAQWRAWLTDKIAGWWVKDQRYYRLGLVAPEQSAPEFRIADDVRLAVEPLVEFVLGLASALITAATFAAILWQVAGSFRLDLGGSTVDIPAYMALAAVVYAVITSTAAYVAGRPLVAKVSAKNEAEAQFRAEMTRLRENAESVALIRGDADELSSLRSNYANVLSAWMRVIGQQARIALVLNTNGALFPVIPLLLATPKYLSGELTLGGVVQVVAAFSAVQGALIWFVDNFVRLAEWYASASRVIELTRALEEVDLGTVMEEEQSITIADSTDGAIHLEKLSIADRGGRLVINGASIRIDKGEKVIVTGESGSGKSTLIRAIAGLWPWGSGEIRLPRDMPIAFVPQRPYLPVGTLRDVLLYPSGDLKIEDAAIDAALKRCGLSALAKRLDEPDTRWDQILSGGERQKIAFCRLLIQRPSIIILDESTSALDEDSQMSLLCLLREDLSYATVVSVGHRPGIEDFHDRKIELVKRVAGAEVTSRRLPVSLWHLMRRAMK